MGIFPRFEFILEYKEIIAIIFVDNDRDVVFQKTLKAVTLFEGLLLHCRAWDPGERFVSEFKQWHGAYSVTELIFRQRELFALNIWQKFHFIYA